MTMTMTMTSRDLSAALFDRLESANYLVDEPPDDDTSPAAFISAGFEPFAALLRASTKAAANAVTTLSSALTNASRSPAGKNAKMALSTSAASGIAASSILRPSSVRRTI